MAAGLLWLMVCGGCGPAVVDGVWLAGRLADRLAGRLWALWAPPLGSLPVPAAWLAGLLAGPELYRLYL